mgnify:CR=1 FL=1
MYMVKKEFKIIGLNMESISILYGIFLILWGLLVNFASSSSSLTSLIPSIMGIPILFFSILAITFFNKKKIDDAYSCILWAYNNSWWIRHI